MALACHPELVSGSDSVYYNEYYALEDQMLKRVQHDSSLRF
jgi:hypothetical protein